MSKLPLPVRRNGAISPLTQRFCRGVVRLLGWRVDKWVITDEVKKAVVIGEHHTSMMDGVMMILMVAAMGKRLQWLVKEEFNKPVIGTLIRATGGIFVDRHHPNGTVGHVVEIIKESDNIFLALAPSSTRAYTDHWRTGFYYMALGAEVPVGLGYLDYANKRGGVGKLITLSGDPTSDEPIFQEFYKDITARYPEKTSEVRFKPKQQLPSERRAG